MIGLVRHFKHGDHHSEDSTHTTYKTSDAVNVYLLFFFFFVCLASELACSLGTSPTYDFRRSNSFPHLKFENPPPQFYDFERLNTFPRVLYM